MKFKIGDKVRAIDNHYDLTNKKEEWEGEVVEVLEEHFNAKTTKCEILGMIGENLERLKYSHFELISPFTKTDLKNGDIVTLRNGDRLIYYDKEFINMSYKNDNRLNRLKDLNEEMHFIYYGVREVDEKNDIVKIERPTEYETVFGREEIKEMTVKEIEKQLGYKIKVVEEE